MPALPSPAEYRANALPEPARNSRRAVPHDPLLQRAIELVGRRWSGAVVSALMERPARFNQLLSGIPHISDRVLTERLRELETEGLVERIVDPGPPVRVTYRLTERGRSLQPVLEAIGRWASEWMRPATAVS